MHAGETSPAATGPVVIAVQGLPGCDVSEYEGTIDWAKLAADKKFCFIRALHGLHRDATFGVNWSEAARVSVMRGAYVYLDPTLPYAPQVRAFVQMVHVEKGDFAPVLDLEDPKIWSHLKQPDRIKYVLKWAKVIEHVYGVKPIIYLSPLFVPNVLGTQYAQQLAGYPLWIANYHVSKPTVPLPWTDYIIWQYAEDGTCIGVTGPCDLDIAPGGAAALSAFTVKQAAGGDDSVLTADDLNDGGLTVRVRGLRHEDSQHGRHNNQFLLQQHTRPHKTGH
jgi:lysozyme